MEQLTRAIGVTFGTLRAEYRQITNRYFGHVERLDGDAREVCEQIIDRLWEGDFYRTSLGHFDFFWIRDFGTVCQSLVRLGYQQRVHQTLHWAMIHYRRSGHVTLCIDKSGHCFNAPGKSIDALPWLLHCLVVSGYELNKSDVRFLNRELRKFRKRYLDHNGNIRQMKYAEMRDAVMYDRSAYSVALVARLAACAETLELTWSTPVDHYRQLLVTKYWNGHYFNADFTNTAFSAECALFPFFLDIVTDERMVEQTFKYIDSQRLNEPYPLIYTNTPEKFRYHWWMTAPWMPDYEGRTIWSWHGEYYLHLLKRYHHPNYKREYDKFCNMIELHGMFPEMLNLDGSWYYAPIYRGDPGMVWAALFLELPEPKQS
jgi:hypothetical protein